MSIEALDWAFKLRIRDASVKLTLLAICNHYNKKHWGCWPSLALLEKETGLSERTVRRCIRKLERWGMVISGERPGTSNFFEVRVDAWFPSEAIEKNFPSDELATLGIVINRRERAAVQKLVDDIQGGGHCDRRAAIEVTHPWHGDPLIIIEPEYKSFEDMEALASEVSDWELKQLGWVPPVKVESTDA